MHWLEGNATRDPAGTRLGPYEIVAPIGAGGMGEVYRARDPRLGRDVAVKVLPQAATEDATRLARFAQEARTIAGLSHPNLLQIFDVGTGDRRTWSPSCSTARRCARAWPAARSTRAMPSAWPCRWPPDWPRRMPAAWCTAT